MVQVVLGLVFTLRALLMQIKKNCKHKCITNSASFSKAYKVHPLKKNSEF